MSIGQKFEQVADLVYEKGYTKGGLDASPQETVSGEIVAITDISPIEHNVAVKASSNNLFKTTNYSKGSLTPNTGVVGGNTETFITTDFIYLPSGNYILSNITGANLRYIAFYNLNKEFVNNTWSNREKKFKFKAQEDCFIRVDIEKDGGVKIDNFDTIMHEYQFMLEEGTTATPYTPFVPDVSVATVKTLGKNLFDISKIIKNITSVTNTENSFTVDYSNVSDNTFVASYWLDVMPNVNYVVSVKDCKSVATVYFYTDKLFGTKALETKQFSNNVLRFNSGQNNRLLLGLYSIANDRKSTTETIENFQIEFGTKATPYEPYIEPTSYPIAADGTVEGVTSIYPNMTITTDTVGVVIDANYYQDGKKVKENLIDMILSLGGVINE